MSRQFYKIYFFVVYFITGLNSLSAQEGGFDSSLFNISLTELNNIVVTPSKFRQRAGNVTQKVDLLSKTNIESTVMENRNLCELLQKLPGTSISVLSRNDANWGTYGGIGPNYCTYILQGIPIDDFIDPMTIELSAIDHIEVQRGPASIFYPNYLSQDFAGSQSSLAGTVNLVLKDKIEEPMTSLQTSAGTYNTVNCRLLHQNSLGQFNYFSGLSYETSDYTNYGAENSWLDIRDNPEYKKTKLYCGLTLFTDESENSKLTLFYNLTQHTGNRGRTYLDYDHSYSLLNTGFSSSITESIDFQTNYGIRLYDRSWAESNAGAGDTLKAHSGVKQQIVPLDISLSWKHFTGSFLSIGADYQSAVYSTWTDPLLGYHVYGNKSNSSQTGVYIQEEMNLDGRYILRGGIRYAEFKNEINYIHGSMPEKPLSSWKRFLWSVGMRYLFRQNISIYANSGNSFLAPSVKSLGGTIPSTAKGIAGKDGQLPNSNLSPEKGIGSDIGIDLQMTEGLSGGLRVFFNLVKDAITENVISQRPSQSQSINAGSSSSMGGELSLSLNIQPTGTFFSNISIINTEVKNDADVEQNGTEIPFAPLLVTNIGAEINLPLDISFVPLITFNNGFYDGTYKNIRNYYRQGFVCNLFISKPIVNKETYALEIFAKLYNITNNRYELPWQFRNPGFSMSIGITTVLY